MVDRQIFICYHADMRMFACAFMSFVVFAGNAASGRVLGQARHVDGVNDRGMGACLCGDTLYCIAGSELYSLDVAEPLAPKILGRIGGMDNARQIVVQGKFVYVVSRETGMRIVDAGDPRNLRLLSRYDSVEFATGIEVVGGTAFLSERIYGVEVVDVSNPEKPRHVCMRKTDESQSCRYRDGWLYSGEWGSGKVTVFDARDLKNFRAVRRIDLGGFGDGLDIDGGFLYCSTGHDARNGRVRTVSDPVGAGRGMDVFSIADPANPKWVSRVDFPVFKPRNEDFWTPRVANGFAFCCDSHNGLFLVDVRDPANPKVVDRLCIAQPGRDWPSAAISSVAVGNGCIYVTCSPGGLFVAPVEGVAPPPRPKGAPPASPDFRETYPTDDASFHVYRPAAAGQARAVCLRGDVAYAAFGDAGLHVLKVSPEGGFSKLGELPGGRSVTDCCFAGDKLVTAEGLDGFAVYDLPAPARFKEVSRRARVDGGSVAFWCWPIDSDKVVLSARGSYSVHSLADFDAEKPLLKFYGMCQWDKYPADGAIGGRYAVLHPYTGMIWLDVADGGVKLARNLKPGDEPVSGNQQCGVCRFGADRYLCTVAVKGKCAFAFLDMDGKMSAPISAGASFGIPRAEGNLVLTTCRSGRKASVWDFADASNPKLLREYALSGNPDAGTFYHGRAIIPAGHQGLVMEKHSFENHRTSKEAKR